MNAVARQEEQLSALQEQLEYTQLKLSSTQASGGHPQGLTKPNLTATGFSSVFMAAGGLGPRAGRQRQLFCGCSSRSRLPCAAHRADEGGTWRSPPGGRGVAGVQPHHLLCPLAHTCGHSKGFFSGLGLIRDAHAKTPEIPAVSQAGAARRLLTGSAAD